jgi:ABC-2 type transport system permease protein
MNYIIAESIKTRKTILTYFIALAPVINILMCVLIAGLGNVQSFGIYWWCTFMMPALAALFCAEHERRNRMSGNDKMLYTYPIDLFGFRIAGITAIAIKIFLVYLVMALVLSVLSPFVGMMRISVLETAGAFGVLFVCSLWMIPACLILSRRFNIYLLMAVNVICNIALPPFIAGTAFWVLCPYCYGPKAIEALAGIQISGDIMEAAGANYVVIVAMLAAIAVFNGLAAIEARIFAKGYPEKKVRKNDSCAIDKA